MVFTFAEGFEGFANKYFLGAFNMLGYCQAQPRVAKSSMVSIDCHERLDCAKMDLSGGFVAFQNFRHFSKSFQTMLCTVLWCLEFEVVRDIRIRRVIVEKKKKNRHRVVCLKFKIRVFDDAIGARSIQDNRRNQSNEHKTFAKKVKA